MAINTAINLFDAVSRLDINWDTVNTFELFGGSYTSATAEAVCYYNTEAVLLRLESADCPYVYRNGLLTVDLSDNSVRTVIQKICSDLDSYLLLSEAEMGYHEWCNEYHYSLALDYLVYESGLNLNADRASAILDTIWREYIGNTTFDELRTDLLYELALDHLNDFDEDFE